MPPERERVLAEALKLPSTDRAAIAGALLRSLDATSDEDEGTVEAAWADEVRRRLADLDAGTAETLSVEEARRFITSDAAEDR
jgi:putative addiction module component (TIGR02574 family)